MVRLLGFEKGDRDGIYSVRLSQPCESAFIITFDRQPPEIDQSVFGSTDLERLIASDTDQVTFPLRVEPFRAATVVVLEFPDRLDYIEFISQNDDAEGVTESSAGGGEEVLLGRTSLTLPSKGCFMEDPVRRITALDGPLPPQKELDTPGINPTLAPSHPWFFPCGTETSRRERTTDLT